jgi:integrase/recombinase XerD
VWRLSRARDDRHTLAMRALEDCTRSEVEAQALALSTYLRHARLANTYWYVHATPRLMTGIADECRAFVHGETP